MTENPKKSNEQTIEKMLSAGKKGKTGRGELYQRALTNFLKNKLAIVGLFLVGILMILAIFADDWFIAIPLGREARPLLARTPYDKIFFGPAGAFPSLEYWMGTDLNGRDFYSRVIFGTRISLAVGFLSQAIAVLIGIPLGALAGFYGGKTDYWIMRFVDLFAAFPNLLFAYLIMTLMGAGFWNVMLAIGITTWIPLCRLTRAQFLSLREKEFVTSAQMIGAKPVRIVLKHLLPNAIAPIIVSLTMEVPLAIFAEASLSFLGVGINPPTPSWGQMIGRDGLDNISYYWHLAFFPAAMIAVTMLGFTLMGDGLRDAFDPTMIDN
jgi:oligopeptide transport system permease protein